MLRSLLYREWMLNRLPLLIVLAMFAAVQVYFVLRVDAPRLWMVFTGVFMAFQTIVPFTREDKFQSAGWTCTLPVLRREIVQARWAGAWLCILAGLLIAVLMDLLLPGTQAKLAQAMLPDTLLLVATVVTLILVLALPFTIRYGLMGVMIFMVVAQLTGAALLVVVMMSRGRNGGIGRALHTIIEGTRGGLLSMQEALTPTVFHVTVLAALLLLNWLGYRLAVALYHRREF
jgi:hypothetical protein